MVALLGLLAVAGYQNRDKLAEAFGGAKQQPGGQTGRNDQPGDQGGLLGKLGSVLSGASAGSVLSGGLGDLIALQAEAWPCPESVNTVQISRSRAAAQAIGPDALNTLQQPDSKSCFPG
jgi:hypothetical protein